MQRFNAMLANVGLSLPLGPISLDPSASNATRGRASTSEAAQELAEDGFDGAASSRPSADGMKEGPRYDGLTHAAGPASAPVLPTGQLNQAERRQLKVLTQALMAKVAAAAQQQDTKQLLGNIETVMKVNKNQFDLQVNAWQSCLPSLDIAMSSLVLQQKFADADKLYDEALALGSQFSQARAPQLIKVYGAFQDLISQELAKEDYEAAQAHLERAKCFARGSLVYQPNQSPNEAITNLFAPSCRSRAKDWFLKGCEEKVFEVLAFSQRYNAMGSGLPYKDEVMVTFAILYQNSIPPNVGSLESVRGETMGVAVARLFSRFPPELLSTEDIASFLQRRKWFRRIWGQYDNFFDALAHTDSLALENDFTLVEELLQKGLMHLHYTYGESRYAHVQLKEKIWRQRISKAVIEQAAGHLDEAYKIYSSILRPKGDPEDSKTSANTLQYWPDATEEYPIPPEQTPFSKEVIRVAGTNVEGTALGLSVYAGDEASAELLWDNGAVANEVRYSDKGAQVVEDVFALAARKKMFSLCSKMMDAQPTDARRELFDKAFAQMPLQP